MTMKSLDLIENWKLCDFRYCPQIVQTLIVHQISVHWPDDKLAEACRKVFTQPVCDEVMALVREHRSAIDQCQGIHGNSVYVLLNYGLTRPVIKEHLYGRADLEDVLFMKQDEIMRTLHVSVYTGRKIIAACRFALHDLVEDDVKAKQDVLCDDLEIFFSSLDAPADLQTIKEGMLWRSGDALLNNLLNDLCDSRIISRSGDQYQYIDKKPSLSTVLDQMEDEKEQKAAVRLLYGKSVSRHQEAIARAAIFALPPVAEDKYIDLIQTCDISETVFYQITNALEPTYRYLQIRYPVSEPKQPVTGRTLSGPIRQERTVDLKKLQKYLEKEYFPYNETWISKEDRGELLREVCRSFDGYFSKEQLIQRFNDVVAKVRPERMAQWRLDDFRADRISLRGYLVTSMKRGIRYRPVNADFVQALIDDLDIMKYRNTVLSAKKLFDEAPNIMEKYDIRDQYELHSILRIAKETYAVEINRWSIVHTPMIQFGSGDEDQIIEEEIRQLAPISVQNFVRRMCRRYGYDTGTFTKYLYKNFSSYIHDRILDCVDTAVMESEDYQTFKGILTEDFYFSEDVKKLLKEHDLPASLNDPYVLRRLGYKCHSGYILKDKYNGLQYFRQRILDDPDLVLSPRYNRIWSFASVASQMEQNLEIVEVDRNEYRTPAQLGLRKKELRTFARNVINYVEADTYFNDASLAADRIAQSAYSNTFYKSLLKSDPQIRSISINHVWVFKKSKKDASIGEFLRSIIVDRMTISGLCTVLKERFDIDMEKGEVMRALRQSGIYYSADTERIYRQRPPETTYAQERLF